MQFTELSNESLSTAFRNRKRILVLYIVAVSLMASVSFFQVIENDIKAITVLPLCFLPIVIANWRTYQSMKKELESRK